MFRAYVCIYIYACVLHACMCYDSICLEIPEGFVEDPGGHVPCVTYNQVTLLTTFWDEPWANRWLRFWHHFVTTILDFFPVFPGIRKLLFWGKHAGIPKNHPTSWQVGKDFSQTPRGRALPPKSSDLEMVQRQLKKPIEQSLLNLLKQSITRHKGQWRVQVTWEVARKNNGILL